MVIYHNNLLIMNWRSKVIIWSMEICGTGYSIDFVVLSRLLFNSDEGVFGVLARLRRNCERTIEVDDKRTER